MLAFCVLLQNNLLHSCVYSIVFHAYTHSIYEYFVFVLLCGRCSVSVYFVGRVHNILHRHHIMMTIANSLSHSLVSPSCSIISGYFSIVFHYLCISYMRTPCMHSTSVSKPLCRMKMILFSYLSIFCRFRSNVRQSLELRRFIFSRFIFS